MWPPYGWTSTPSTCVSRHRHDREAAGFSSLFASLQTTDAVPAQIRTFPTAIMLWRAVPDRWSKSVTFTPNTIA